MSRARADASADVTDARRSGDAAPDDVGDAAALDAPAEGPPRVGTPPDAVTAWIAGSVFHADLGDPLMSARVTVDGASGPSSDADGLFSVTVPRGLHTLTVSLAGYLPARVEVVAGHAPTELRVPLMPEAAAQPVGPAGATLSLGDHGEVVFPPNAVPTTANVSATWVPAHALEALAMPAAVETGANGWVTPRGALVVSDLLLDRAARVRLRRPADLTADQCELRGLRDDGTYAERFDPVAHGGGLVEFDVAHFSTYVLVEKRGPAPTAMDCENPTPGFWSPSTSSIVRNGAVMEASPQGPRQQFEARCGDVSNADNAQVLTSHGTLTAFTAARFTLRHGPFWRAVFNQPLTAATEEIKLRANKNQRIGITLPHDTGVWEIVALEDAPVTVRALACSNGARGYAIHHIGTSGATGRVWVTPPGGAVAEVGRNTEWKVCPPGSAAPAAVAVMAPQCLTPEGCAAGLRCDAAARRCVASMGGACTGNADCDVGLACAGGRCAPSPMPAPGARQACRTDADCPDQRCDRGSGACGGFTTNGQRACALTRECPQDYACVGGACRPSGSYVCAGASDCPAAHECRRSRCVPSAAPSCTDARECPQGDYACVDGRCVLLVVCAPDQTLCSNRCVSPSSTSYCVACGLVSHERPNATATCGNRGLRLSCRGMFGDCDGNTENGCEAPLFSNTHCGRCGAACANGQTCDGGRCGTVARSTVVQVALGRAHGCARYANGRVRCWGAGPGGPPPGTTPAARTPPEDMGLDGVTQIVSGSNHACALRDDRRLWCWGRNNLRQLGDGTAIDRPTPVLVRSGVLEVAAGDEFTCVRGADTQIVCWGANAQGQLGPMRNADGSMGTLQITPELNFAQIAAGRGHACLRSATGAVHCWGRNASGQSLGALADGRAALQSGPTDVAEISLAGDVSVARKNDGTVWVWGAPVGGPDTVPLSRRATPTQVPLPGPAVQVAAGPLHICARLMDNRVVCWGQGDVVRSPTPRVMGSEAASTVAVGLQNACVVRNSDSAVLCWGSGDEGMMLPSGDGARVENPTAMPLF